MPGRTEFDFGMRRPGSGRPLEQTPFSLLVLGEYGGDRTPGDAADARIRQLDIDNFEQLWDVFQPAVTLDLGGSEATFEPRELEHFHPDHLYHALPQFGELRRLRKRLLNPDTAEATLAEVLAAGSEQAAPRDPVAEAGPQQPAESGAAMFSRLLGDRPASAEAPSAPAATALDRLIRHAVAPHIVGHPDPRVDAAVDSVDRASADLMREVLRAAGFRQLESAWRSLADLVQGTETSESLEIRVCSVSREALLDALPASAADFEDSNIWRLLVERVRLAADDRSPTVLVAGYFFGTDADDIALLAALGSIGDASDSVVLGAARPQTVGCDSLADSPDHRAWRERPDGHELWLELRRAPFARRIGLALPRLLGRLPYGPDTDPVSAFDFEEMPEREHQHYLWSNPATALAGQLAGHFSREGWSMDPGALDFEGLPAHTYSEDGESKIQPCAEVLLSEAAAVEALNRGIMPIVSYRNQDRAQLVRLQSIAEPLAPLQGRWKTAS